MSIRSEEERWEKEHLSKWAQLSSRSKGRSYYELPCQVRTCFQRDRDRIIHSKAFRRLKHKTQVFIAPEGDHYRTRLTHTLEVSQIARTIARALRLNEDLTEAAALGHDLGHTPFGHAGEEALNSLMLGGFRHNEQSLRVVECLEQEKGLNLTREVNEGILKHTGKEVPAELEGQIVRVADRIAYLNHDIDDALRAGILTMEDLPNQELSYLGFTSSQRINTMVVDIIENSRDSETIRLSSTMQEVMESMRNFMFKQVYINPEAKKEEPKAKMVVEQLFQYFIEQPEELPFYREEMANEEIWRETADYIAGMTDRFIITLYQDIFVPHPWKK